MSATSERDSVARLAPLNPSEALDRAREIRDPWFRCQALSYVARYSQNELVQPIAEEALEAARQHTDPYKHVTVAAWPVRALIERGVADRAAEALYELADIGKTIEHPVSRLEALLLLWEAAFPLDDAAADEILEIFRAACRAATSWKAGDRLERALLVLASRDSQRASGLMDEMRDSKYKRRLTKRLAAGVSWPAKEFFARSA